MVTMESDGIMCYTSIILKLCLLNFQLLNIKIVSNTNFY